jgi:hypothetical protein
MRFKDQVRWSRKWGAVSLLFSTIALGVLFVLREKGMSETALRWADFSTAFFGLSALILLFGGLLRPLQKSAYHQWLEGNERYRKTMGVNPVTRWFWWLDTEGRDRDA